MKKQILTIIIAVMLLGLVSAGISTISDKYTTLDKTNEDELKRINGLSSVEVDYNLDCNDKNYDCIVTAKQDGLINDRYVFSYKVCNKLEIIYDSKGRDTGNTFCKTWGYLTEQQKKDKAVEWLRTRLVDYTTAQKLRETNDIIVAKEIIK